MPAIRLPVDGAERVATLLAGFSRAVPGAEVSTTLVNGAVAGRIDLAGEPDTAVTFAVEDGRISHIYVIRNPHKLGSLGRVVELRR